MEHIIPGFKTFDQIAREGREALLRGGLNNLNAGSSGRALVEHIDKSLAEVYEAIDTAFQNTHIETATGVWLDLIGLDIGLPRLGATPARTSPLQRFYVPRGTLGDFTKGKDLVLGPSVRVATASGQHPIYLVIPFKGDSLSFPVWRADQREIIVRLEAVTRGDVANTGANTLVSHNLPNSHVLTTNISPIGGNRSLEDDLSYRYRLEQALLAGQGSNVAAIERAALEELDVDSVVVTPFIQGPGSVGITVVPSMGAGSEDLRQRVERKVAEVVSAGEAIYVKLARTRDLRMSVRVISSEDPSRVVAETRQVILDYLGALDAGDPLIITALQSQVLTQTVSTISDVTVLSIRVDEETYPGQNIRLDNDEVFVVPAPEELAIQIDVVTR